MGSEAFTKKEKEGLSDFRNWIKNSNSRMEMSDASCALFPLLFILYVPYSWILTLLVQILGVLDIGKDAWIHREDWIKNGVHIGSGRKYKDSYFLQAQVMCYYNV